ncbi:MAG: carbon-nitrogen hydrolase family protein [Acidiferrobacter sp.]
MQIAALQMTSGNCVADNLAAAAVLLRAAAAAGAVLAVLPENFALMTASHDERLAHAEIDGAGVIQEALSALSRECRLWIVGGTIPLLTGDPRRVRAGCLVYDDCGQRVARYDKIHLFDVDLGGGERYAESAAFEAGSVPVVVTAPFGRIGLSVCYDLRFPELFRRLVDEGAEILAVPAAFTVLTGEAHWQILLQARAIENSCYVVAAAQSGQHGQGRSTYGHSMVLDPWGAVLNCAPSAPGVVTAAYRREYLQEVRSRLPSIRHRRL